MNQCVTNIQTDYVIAGSGPGGATVARELSKAGKKVVLLEMGRHHTSIGNTAGVTLVLDKFSFLKSDEGLPVLRAITTGGSSLIYCGTSVKPPFQMFDKYGIDLRPQVSEIEKELPINELPFELIGTAAARIMRAAKDLGFNWNLMKKFIRPERCVPNCGACMLGCKREAKWTSREFVREAALNGAKVMNRMKVRDVLVQNGSALGVVAEGPQGRVMIEAGTTIISAGGLGSPVILQRSGIYDAGDRFFADPLVMTMGAIESRGSARDIPMTAGTLEFQEKDGIVMTDLIDPYASFLMQCAFKGIRYIPRWVKYGRTLGIMTKVRDDVNGRVNLDESFSKPISYAERWKLDKGANIAERILLKAGAAPESIFSTGIRASHPGGTCRIGKIVDKNLKTEIGNLYVCDASAIPEPFGLPVVFTCLALGKYLAGNLTAGKA